MTASEYRFTKHIEERGELFTSFDQQFFAPSFSLDKVSVSKKGVIRGFHGDDDTWKLISCMYGAFKLVVYDIDLGRRQVFVLSDQYSYFSTILVPPRHLNAHQCLTDKCILHYKWDQPYDLSKQYSVHYLDEMINANWEDIPVILSDRDKKAKGLHDVISNSSK